MYALELISRSRLFSFQQPGQNPVNNLVLRYTYVAEMRTFFFFNPDALFRVFDPCSLAAGYRST
jgi:hypothetical protein